jgi:hypothetical protein
MRNRGTAEYGETVFRKLQVEKKQLLTGRLRPSTVWCMNLYANRAELYYRRTKTYGKKVI